MKEHYSAPLEESLQDRETMLSNFHKNLRVWAENDRISSEEENDTLSDFRRKIAQEEVKCHENSEN